MTDSTPVYYARYMSVSEQELLHHLARLPFIDAGELALILGEPLATVHRNLTALLKDDLAQWVSHGTARLPPATATTLRARMLDV